MEKTVRKPGTFAISNLALHHLVEELQVLVNGFINNSQTLDNGWIKMKIHTKATGDKNLIISPNALFIASTSVPARQNPGGFSAFAKKYIYNQRIISLKQQGLDRIVVFEYPEKFLILELFAKGNLVLCDKDMTILMAMKKEEWKDRKLEKGAKYKPPSSKGTSVLEETAGEFATKMKVNAKTSFGAAVDLLNVAPGVMEHVFEELKIDKKKNASELNDSETKKILSKCKEIYSSKSAGSYLSGGVLYSAELGKTKEKEFASVNDALDKLLLNEALSAGTADVTEKTAGDIVKVNAISAKDKALKELDLKLKEIAELEEEETGLKKKAEKIYVNYDKIKQVMDAIKKGRAKGLAEKEIMDRIQSVLPILAELSLSDDKLVLKL
ncbi:MAG: NFACT family protein [archaeon]